MRRIYLDHVSATPVLGEVLELMREFWGGNFGNPASLHSDGVRARIAMERAREQTAAFLGASTPEEIVFTSDGAESTNLAIKGLAAHPRRRGNHVVTTSLEHPSIRRCAGYLRGQGIIVSEVGPDREGLVSVEGIRAALTPETFLIATHVVNHDLGVIQAVEQTGALALEHGIPLFVDAESAAGWVPLDVDRLGASLLSCSAHRFCGPKGVGVLFKNRRVRLIPQIVGGDQEFGIRAGVENVAGIAGAGLAAEVAGRDLPNRALHGLLLQRRFLEKLRGAVPGVHLHGPEPGPSRSPQSLFLSIEGIEGEGLILFCDLQGVALHAGSACTSRLAKMPPALQAIGVPPAVARGAILVSFGVESTQDEVDVAVRVITTGVARLRELAPTSAMEPLQAPSGVVDR